MVVSSSKTGSTRERMSTAAITIQCAVRMFLAARITRARRMEWRLATRHQRNPMDACSCRCLLLLQRMGRGMLSRVRTYRRSTTKLVPMGRRRSSLTSLASSGTLRSHKKKKWIPLGYNPPRSEADRTARLRAVHQQTRVKAAMSIQSWWREQLKRSRILNHSLRVSGLVLLNVKAILIQRWWRCYLRQRKFVAPSTKDVHSAALAIVSAEELRMHRSVQAAPLKKLWLDVVQSERKSQHQKKKDGVPERSASRLLRQSSGSGVDWELTEVTSGMGSFMFDSDIPSKLLALQNHSNASVGCGGGVSPHRKTKLQRMSYNARPRYLPTLQTSRYRSSHDVAVHHARPEWNGSHTPGVPKWYAAPHDSSCVIAPQ
ncbi:IQ calmodulin-binding protein, putative [Bodo saltans]|uniref:IQ calmodulin-binding protein, putative n=1 Tax=Bodo saltans TaxID=75058 RepID=A0A0S4JPK3_BODSA|nr:IQ calmodulin-binding protein, putative [Bodo saltans]|eukprot:CUG91295.1 IQ calmodulin-binding protein, putative [Bodo saltans]